jgi:hypothetical protein
MNERIKELAEQCRFEIQGINCEVLSQGFDEEKFAELLEKEFEAKHFSAGYIAGQSDGISETVRECGVALSPMLRDMVSRGQAFDLIKEHFGVEE